MKSFCRLLILTVVALTACTRSDVLSAEAAASMRAHGIADAMKVITSTDSMSMERHILEIRNTENKIKQTGNLEAARLYIEVADSTLREAGIFN